MTKAVYEILRHILSFIYHNFLQNTNELFSLRKIPAAGVLQSFAIFPSNKLDVKTKFFIRGASIVKKNRNSWSEIY